MPLDIGHAVAGADLSGDGTIFATIEERTGLFLDEIVQTITAVSADKELCGLMNIKLHASLLRMDQVLHSDERGAVEYSQTYYRPDLFRPTLRLSRSQRPNRSQS